MKLFSFLLILCSRKASMKDKVFPSPSKAPMVKGKALSPGVEDGAEASPNKLSKSGSFNEKNRGQKHSLKVRGSASRQNSDGKKKKYENAKAKQKSSSEVWLCILFTDFVNMLCKTCNFATSYLKKHQLSSDIPALYGTSYEPVLLQ